MLEYSDRKDAEQAVRDLDGRRVQGCRGKLRATHGDLAAEGTLGQYKGYGQYGSGRSRSPRRDDARRGSPPRRSYSPPRRRTPPRQYSPSPPSPKFVTKTQPSAQKPLATTTFAFTKT